MTERERLRDLAYWFVVKDNHPPWIGDGNKLNGWISSIQDGYPPPFMLCPRDLRYIKKMGGAWKGYND